MTGKANAGLKGPGSRRTKALAFFHLLAIITSAALFYFSLSEGFFRPHLLAAAAVFGVSQLFLVAGKRKTASMISCVSLAAVLASMVFFGYGSNTGIHFFGLPLLVCTCAYFYGTPGALLSSVYGAALMAGWGLFYPGKTLPISGLLTIGAAFVLTSVSILLIVKRTLATLEVNETIANELRKRIGCYLEALAGILKSGDEPSSASVSGLPSDEIRGSENGNGYMKRFGHFVEDAGIVNDLIYESPDLMSVHMRRIFESLAENALGMEYASTLIIPECAALPSDKAHPVALIAACLFRESYESAKRLNRMFPVPVTLDTENGKTRFIFGDGSGKPAACNGAIESLEKDAGATRINVVGASYAILID